MKLTNFAGRRQQRGIVAVMAVIFLIAVVIFVLVQSLSITGTTSVDNKQQLDSTRALFLAESGLEKAHAIIAMAAKGTFSKDNCCIGSACSSTNSLPSGDQSLGNGSFKYVSATPTPSTCDGLGTACTACTVEVAGTVDSANRQISRTFGIVAGLAPAYCNTALSLSTDCSNQTTVTATPAAPATWSLTLNHYASPAVAGVGVFNLAAAMGTDATALAGCYSGGCLSSGGSPYWTLQNTSVFGLGTSVAQATTDSVVYQRLSNSRNDVALTGALFPGATTAGSVVGSYAGSSTMGGSTTYTGQTSNGGVKGAWCDAGDALVFGFSANSTSAKSDQLQNGNVLFDTRGGSAGIPLSLISKIPTSADIKASEKVYSEMWYRSNPAYSYGKWITGRVVPVPVSLSWKLDKSAPPNGTGTINTAVSATVGVGDAISNVNCPSNPFPANEKILAFGSSCDITTPQKVDVGLVICFTLTPGNSSNSCTGSSSGLANQVKLEVSQVNGGTNAADIALIANGDTLVGSGVMAGTTIVSKLTTDAGFIATYQINQNATATTDTTMVVGGASMTTSGTTTTVTVASGSLPTDGTIVQLRNLYSGSGKFDTYTVAHPVSGSTTQFTLSKPASVTADPYGAVICGGTCAFFDPTTAAATTFRIASGTSTFPAGTANWAAGFVCLKNVGSPTVLLGGNGSAITPGAWSEVVR